MSFRDLDSQDCHFSDARCFILMSKKKKRMNERSSAREGLIREQLPSFEAQSASEVGRSDAGEVAERSVMLRSETTPAVKPLLKCCFAGR